jgi:hypothetical protein
MKKLTEQTTNELRQLVQDGAMTPETFVLITNMVETNFDNWIQSKIEQLKSMVTDWETSIGDDDKSFYTLGLRRAIDVIGEETAYSQLPILEKPDTPDEK